MLNFRVCSFMSQSLRNFFPDTLNLKSEKVKLLRDSEGSKERLSYSVTDLDTQWILVRLGAKFLHSGSIELALNYSIYNLVNWVRSRFFKN